jgi:predicted membrane protein
VSDERPPDEERDRPDESESSVRPATAAELPPAEPTPRQLPLSRLILGLVLVAIGVIWLLEALDVVSFSLLAVLPGALIVVGIVLIAAARTGRHSPLIVLGVILTVILTLASSLDIRLQGGVGERTERPAALADVQSEYRLSVGQLTIDLTAVDFSTSQNTRVTASIGIGQLEIRVPESAQVVAVAHAGAGQVVVFGREVSGFDVDLTARRPPGLDITGGTGILTLDLSVGLGQIEVRA